VSSNFTGINLATVDNLLVTGALKQPFGLYSRNHTPLQTSACGGLAKRQAIRTRNRVQSHSSRVTLADSRGKCMRTMILQISCLAYSLTNMPQNY